MLSVRPYLPTDHTFVISLAPRLAIGMQPWLTTVEGWLTESISQHNQKAMVLVAEDEQGERLARITSRIR